MNANERARAIGAKRRESGPVQTASTATRRLQRLPGPRSLSGGRVATLTRKPHVAARFTACRSHEKRVSSGGFAQPRPQLLEQPWADPVHEQQLIHVVEAAVEPPVLDDARRQHGADAGQPVEIRGAGAVEVERLRCEGGGRRAGACGVADRRAA